MTSEDSASTAAGEAVREAIDAELRLLDPAVRASPEAVAELLDPRFVEFGASGRRWDAETILSATTPAPGAPAPAITTERMSGELLAPGVVHLTYVSDADGRRARRSSLWRRTPTGWRLYFHQGTRVPPGVD